MCTKTNVLVFNWTFWLINMVMFAGHSIWVALTHLHTRRSHVNNTQTFDTDLDVLLSLKKKHLFIFVVVAVNNLKAFDAIYHCVAFHPSICLADTAIWAVGFENTSAKRKHTHTDH